MNVTEVDSLFCDIVSRLIILVVINKKAKLHALVLEGEGFLPLVRRSKNVFNRTVSNRSHKPFDKLNYVKKYCLNGNCYRLYIFY